MDRGTLVLVQVVHKYRESLIPKSLIGFRIRIRHRKYFVHNPTGYSPLPASKPTSPTTVEKHTDRAESTIAQHACGISILLELVLLTLSRLISAAQGRTHIFGAWGGSKP